MSITDGSLPQDASGRSASGGYSPNVGVLPFQLGTPTSDSQSPPQPSAPLVVQQNAASITSATLQNAAALTADGAVFSVSGMASVSFTLSTTGFSGTVLFEGTADGSTYSNILATKQGTSTVATGTGSLSTDTSTSIWIAQIAGLTFVKAPITRSAGSITITATASPISNPPPSTGTIGTALVEYASATPVATDQAGTQPQVSLYVKKSAAGDTVLALGQSTAANSLPVVLASDQSPADITVFASAARTTTQTQTDQTTPFSVKGLRVVFDVTVVPGSAPGLTLEIDSKDVASGKYTSLLTGTSVATVTTHTYVVYPTITASSNAIAQDVLGHTWRIVVTAGNANSATYSVGASYLY